MYAGTKKMMVAFEIDDPLSILESCVDFRLNSQITSGVISLFSSDAAEAWKGTYPRSRSW